MKEITRRIQNADPESAEQILREYVNSRIANSIDACWSKFRTILRCTRAFREKQCASAYINHVDGVITIKGFTEYIDSVEKEINKIPTDCGFKAEVVDILYERIGNIKIDKRLLLRKDD